MIDAGTRSYMRMRRLRESDEYPADLYSEMAGDRNKVRKVDVFRYGRMQAADGSFSTQYTSES